MTSLSALRQEWFGNVRNDVLAGLVVALALIPEAIAFSIIAGVDPKIGLYASFSIALIIAFTGGRRGMISAATASMAVVMVTLVADYGLQYLLAATILTGILQMIAGFARLGLLMRFVSRSVLTGFVNALAILIFLAQLPELVNVTWVTYVLVAAGLGIIYGLPRITKLVPSPLVCILILTAVSLLLGLDVHTVGDMGELPSSLPVFLLPDVPFTFETLQIIFPYAATLAVVGLLESLLTASIVDEMTDTGSDKNRECVGQGTANIITGFLGGMAGCAMIGQSVINVKSGGRGRLSTFAAGAFLLFLILVVGDLVSLIPMAALVAVMIMVAISTFNWGSIRDLARHPRLSSLVMVATVIVVVATNNLGLGVLVGVLLSGLFFAWKVAKLLTVTSTLDEETSHRTYVVEGAVFFASAVNLTEALNVREEVDRVTIDVSRAHIWDLTAVATIEQMVAKFHKAGAIVDVIGLNRASSALIDRLGAGGIPATDPLEAH